MCDTGQQTPVSRGRLKIQDLTLTDQTAGDGVASCVVGHVIEKLSIVVNVVR